MRTTVFTLAVLLSGLCSASVVLPLGDSITVGQWGGGFTPGAYRSRLESLEPSVSFVGPKSDNAAPGQVSPFHAGWSGITSDWIGSHVPLWNPSALQATHVLLMIGTNDVNSGRSVQDTPIPSPKAKHFSEQLDGCLEIVRASGVTIVVHHKCSEPGKRPAKLTVA